VSWIVLSLIGVPSIIAGLFVFANLALGANWETGSPNSIRDDALAAFAGLAMSSLTFVVLAAIAAGVKFVWGLL
jgi:ABC-type phosphate transport system permease subunit